MTHNVLITFFISGQWRNFDVTTTGTQLMFEQKFTKLELTIISIHRSTKQYSHVKYSNYSTEAPGSTNLW